MKNLANESNQSPRPVINSIDGTSDEKDDSLEKLFSEDQENDNWIMVPVIPDDEIERTVLVPPHPFPNREPLLTERMDIPNEEPISLSTDESVVETPPESSSSNSTSSLSEAPNTVPSVILSESSSHHNNSSSSENQDESSSNNQRLHSASANQSHQSALSDQSKSESTSDNIRSNTPNEEVSASLLPTEAQNTSNYEDNTGFLTHHTENQPGSATTTRYGRIIKKPILFQHPHC